MIVCICNAVSERDIEDAVAGGATSMHALRERLAISIQCGSCHGCAEACLERALDRRQSSSPALEDCCPGPVPHTVQV